MKPTAIKEDVFWLGVHDPTLATFDVVVPTPWGTTYNAYLIKGEKNVLVETVKANFREEYLEKLRSLGNPLDVAYVILNHTEPDHAGALPWVLEAAPNARVVTSQAASRHVAALFSLERDVIAAADGDRLDLGDRKLQFIAAPFLHWPDTMFTYDPRTRVLFTCDAFGCHFCKENALFDDEAGDFAGPFRYYYEHIMKPFREHVAAAVAKIENLPIDVVATGHGPVLRADPRKYIGLYREWSRAPERWGVRPLVALFYASAYGNTAELGEQIARGLDAGAVDVALRDLTQTPLPDAKALAERAGGIIIGSPAVMGDAAKPAWDLLGVMATLDVRGKAAAAFGSYGSSGEMVRALSDRFGELGMNVLETEVRVNVAPDEDDYRALQAFGKRFAAAARGK